MSTLSPEQINFLLAPVHPSRVGKDPKGFAHMEAWDVRRTLLRVFGFGGFSTELQDATLVKEIELPSDSRSGRSRWTVIYRATVVLTVRVGGVELGRWHGIATGDATNQPSLADAHDMALKTADSQALKRAAVNLGDQFGLSLYDDGSLDAVVNQSLAHPAPVVEVPKPEPVKPPQKHVRQAPAPKPQAPATKPVPAPVQPALAPSHEAFYKLVTGCQEAAAAATDAETLRGLYREADANGLLNACVQTPGGELPLKNFLIFRGSQLAKKVAA